MNFSDRIQSSKKAHISDVNVEKCSLKIKHSFRTLRLNKFCAHILLATLAAPTLSSHTSVLKSFILAHFRVPSLSMSK